MADSYIEILLCRALNDLHQERAARSQVFLTELCDQVVQLNCFDVINETLAYEIGNGVRADHVCLLKVKELRDLLLNFLLLNVSLHKFNPINLSQVKLR